MDPRIDALRKDYQERIMSPDRDISAGARPAFRYCIASSPRTGSTLLTKMLGATGSAGAPAEYLNPIHVGAWHRLNPGRRIDMPGYLDEIESRRTSANGHFGIKIHWRHVESALGKSLSWTTVSELLGRYRKFILILRRDKISQAVSYFRAQRTGVFHSDQQAWLDDGGRVACDPVLISRIVHDLLHEEAQWRAFLRRSNASCLEIMYEDLVAEYDAVSARILAFLELSGAPVPPMPDTRMRDYGADALKAGYLASLGVVGR